MTKILLAFAMVIAGIYVSAQSNQIDSTGNVGIGTTNPNTPLEVIGKTTLHGVVAIDSSVVIGDSLVIERDTKVKEDLRVDGKGVFEGKLRTKKSIVADKDAKIRRDIIMEGYADSIQTFGLMLLDQNGRTYPIDEKKMQGIVQDMGYREQDCIQDPSGNNVYLYAPIWHNIHPNTLYTGDGNCENRAKVGVNINNPQAGIHLIHDPSLANNLLVVEKFTTTSQPDEIYKMDHLGHTTLNIYEDNNNPQVFKIRNKTIDSTIFEVDQKGLLKAREIKVNLNVWPDYVFDEDYVLMPLSEVEKYIKEKGHLPNVKSAEEIEKEGLGLGESNKVLMEKMEEMTLYMIQLEKKVKALEEKLNIQNK